jgi:hypothetical protein
MNTVSSITLTILLLLIFLIPNKKLIAPFLYGIFLLPLAAKFQLGILDFNQIRILSLVVILKHLSCRLPYGFNKIDFAVTGLGISLIITSILRDSPTAGPLFTMGLVCQVCGSYFALRFLLLDAASVKAATKALSNIFAVIAIGMVVEKFSSYNIFYDILDLSHSSGKRNEVIRAQGPFTHPILAGTTAALTLLFFYGFRDGKKYIFIIGILSSIVIILCSSSSGAIIALLLTYASLFFWNHQRLLKKCLGIFLVLYFAAGVYYDGPAYYQLTRLDFTGGSTGWHRARLLESFFQHFNEWWFIGTDYTRHWMAVGLSSNPNHVDLTNHLIFFAVQGGIISLLFILYILISSLRQVYKLFRSTSSTSSRHNLWILGSSIIITSIMSFSVFFLDQSGVTFWLPFAALPSVSHLVIRDYNTKV